MATMLKIKQILGSSSSSACGCFCVPHRLKKPCSNFPLFSRKPVEATLSKSSTTHFLASQCSRGFFFNALQMSHIHPRSSPDGGSHPSPSTSAAIRSTGITRKIKFCQSCGSPTKYEILDGEDKTRAICTRCGAITYENPKMVVGCLVEHENKILLRKQNIQPSHGHFLLVSWRLGSPLLKEQFEKHGRSLMQKSKSSLRLLYWTSLLLAILALYSWQS